HRGQTRSGPPCAAWVNGTPQRAQHGSVTKPVRPKHSAQSRPGASTGTSQVTQVGGSRTSSAVRPKPRPKSHAVAIRRKPSGSVAHSEMDGAVARDLAHQVDLPGEIG